MKISPLFHRRQTWALVCMRRHEKGESHEPSRRFYPDCGTAESGRMVGRVPVCSTSGFSPHRHLSCLPFRTALPLGYNCGASFMFGPETSSPAMKFRLPRPLWFAIPTVLLVVAAVGLRVGVPIYRQQRAIRAIRQAEGQIDAEPFGPDWLSDWISNEQRKDLGRVTAVRVSGERFTDADS